MNPLLIPPLLEAGKTLIDRVEVSYHGGDGKLYISGADPTTPTDGTVVGTQT